MIGYVKSNNAEKIQRVHQHLQEIEAKLDVDLYGNNSIAIEFFNNHSFSNYDMVNYDERWKEDAYFKRIKIKDVLKTESWGDVIRLVEED